MQMMQLNKPDWISRAVIIFRFLLQLMGVITSGIIPVEHLMHQVDLRLQQAVRM